MQEDVGPDKRRRAALESSAARMVVSLAHQGGLDTNDHDVTLLSHDYEELKRSRSNQQRLADIIGAATRGFFFAAAVGQSFYDPTLIRYRFGRTLRENYPDASEAFINFARTYWTLKLLLSDLSTTPKPTLSEYVLAKVEGVIGPVFFPTPGPEQVEPSHRAATQRQMIEKSGANINVAEFLAGIPILLRDE